MVPDHHSDREKGVALLARYALSSHWCSKAWMTFAVVLAVCLGIVLAFGVSDERVFMPGDVSVKHRLFADKCVNCHTPWKASWGMMSDQPCMSCHDTPPHFGDRSVVNAPQCASCHTEHQGRTVRVDVPDAKCIQCHGALRVKNGQAKIHTEIKRLYADHPEFAVSLQETGQEAPYRVRLSDTVHLQDPAALRLNHKVHLDPNLMGPNGQEPLHCMSCHQVDQQGEYMRPVVYDHACSRCHLLDFDERLPKTVVPHGEQPEAIHRYLRAVYSEYYLFTHEEELRSRSSTRRLPGRLKRAEEVWVDEMIGSADRYLFGPAVSEGRKGKCFLCHIIGKSDTVEASVSTEDQALGNSYPTVLKTAVRERWFPYSIFDHAPHIAMMREQGCVMCHSDAQRSEATSDVLLPRLESCQNCHFEPGGARTQCITCHRYHEHIEPERTAVISEFKKGRM